VHGAATGECPRCGYLGWVPAREVDSRTKKLIVNGAFARRQAIRRGP
jgi:hypothetical protein